MSINVALIGWNGMKNVGDDAMTAIIIDKLAEVKSVDKLLLVSERNESALLFLDAYRKQIDFKFPFLYKYLSQLPVIGGLYYRWYLSVYMILFYNLIIIGGGTLFHSKGLNKFFLNLIRLRKFFNRKVEIVSIGVSVGPFKDDESHGLFHEIIKEIDFIAVRDQRSAAYCFESYPAAKCICAPDIALLMPKLQAIKVEKKQEIGIVLRQGHIQTEIKTLISSAIAHISTHYPNVKIVFHCFCELDNANENDYVAYLALMKEIPEAYQRNIEVNHYQSYPEHFYSALSSSLLNICMRLHGSILSYAMQTPFLMLSYHEKCTDFFNDMGIDKAYLINDYKDIEKVNGLIDKAVNGEIKIAYDHHLDSAKHFQFLDKYN